MAKSIYIPVGGTFNYDGVDLVVVANKYNKAECTGCHFSDWERRKRGKSRFNCHLHGYACTAHMRKDGKQVIFKRKKN